MSEIKKPECDLDGVDGNVYAIIGAVAKCLRRAGLRDRETQWKNEARQQKSYDDVLLLMHSYVEV